MYPKDFWGTFVLLIVTQMDIRFYLKRPDAKQVTAIFARITYEAGQLKYYLPEKINPAYWNSATQRAVQSKRFPEYPEFNARIDTLEQTIRNTYRKYLNDNDNATPSPGTLKELLDTALGKKEAAGKQGFFEYFEDFKTRSADGQRISPKTKKVTVHNTNKGYGTTLKHLENFRKVYQRRIDFDSIDLEFYNDYIKYLTHTVKLSPNTIGDHIKRIKTVLQEAKEKGIKVNPAFESSYFTKPKEDTDSIYLTEAELKELEKLDLSGDKKLDQVRDLFLIGCYTGLRYSDYSVLQPEHIKDGFISIKQAKTGNPVVIPIHPTVKGILDKYNGKLPKAISNQKTNDYLKDLGEKVDALKTTVTKTYTKGGTKITRTFPKYKLMVSHTARRSFATNEYLAGTPSITIMAITGHKTEKAFLGYIKLTPDEHAKLLKLHWEKRAQQRESKLRKAQ